MREVVNYFRHEYQLSVLHKSKVRSIEDILVKLSNYGTVALESIQGCTEEEILEVESIFGRLPIVYKNIMLAIGKGIIGSDRNITSRRNDFYLDEVLDLSFIMTEVDLLESTEGDISFPCNIFFIYDAYGVNVYFLLTDRNDYDAPIFVEDFKKTYLDDEEYVFVKAYDSIWDWIDDYLEIRI
jgi:hypothetical protein